MEDRWLARELELNRKHEELLLRREALLHGTESYYDTQDLRSASFIVDISKAQERNQHLLTDINRLSNNIREEINTAPSPRFETLQKNYWSMVRSVFPVWYEQYNFEIARKQGAKHESLPMSHSIESQRKFSSQHKELPVPTPSKHSPSASKISLQVPHTPQTPVDRLKSIRRSAEHDEATMTDVPPLDLDFSMGDDITASATTTPKAKGEAGSSLDKAHKKERRVHYDEKQLSKAAKNTSSKNKKTM